MGVDHGLGEGLRRFLREIVSEATRDGPVLVSAGELVRVGCLMSFAKSRRYVS